jgi:hypothetical protein
VVEVLPGGGDVQPALLTRDARGLVRREDEGEYDGIYPDGEGRDGTLGEGQRGLGPAEEPHRKGRGKGVSGRMTSSSQLLMHRRDACL